MLWCVNHRITISNLAVSGQDNIVRHQISDDVVGAEASPSVIAEDSTKAVSFHMFDHLGHPLIQQTGRCNDQGCLDRVIWIFRLAVENIGTFQS